MSTPLWQAGHLYLTGDLVQPVQVAATPSSALSNPNFETGDLTGWTVAQTGGTGTASVATDRKYSGTYGGRWQGATGSGHSGGVEALWENATDAPVRVGQSVTAVMLFALDDTDNSQNQAQVRLRWYAADGTTLVRSDSGTLIHGDTAGWRQSTVTGTAPAGAVSVRLAAWTTANSNGGVRLDAASWNHVAPPSTYGLIYKAVQPGPGTSAATEPTWPTTVGVQVVDNTVTWEALDGNRVVWEASPILESDATEPDWPTTPGALVNDGTVAWECVTRRIEDPNCPNSKVVAILSSKVFAVDKDVVRFSATANPLDWTSERDAGFLPTGLQQANANDMAVLAPYRGNLAAFNASSFQMWQTDPDPEAMAQLDQMEGIGSTAYQAARPVGNDLLFLSQLGVRSVSIAAGADNLAAGDVGMPIDPLVQAVVQADPTLVPVATYYPSAGQYWLTFKAAPVLTDISLSGNLPDGTVGDMVSYGYTTHGGRQPYTYTLDSGALPTGLSLNDEGVISGTMTAAGTFTWVVRVTDTDGKTDTLNDGAIVSNATVIYAAVDSEQYMVRSTDGGLNFSNTADPGDSSSSQTVVLVAGTRIYHWSSLGDAKTSTDAATWTTVTGLGFANGAGMLKTASEWLAFTIGNGVYASSDGIAFSSRVASGAALCPAKLGTKIISISGAQAINVSTDDGATWATYTETGFGASNGLTRLLATPSRFLAFGADSGGTQKIAHSTTGASGSWTFASSPATDKVIAVGQNPITGRILIVVKGGTTWYSDDDGATWTAGAALTDVRTAPPENPNNLIYSNGAFLFGSAHGGGFNQIMRSTDGASAWTGVYTAPSGHGIDALAEFSA